MKRLSLAVSLLILALIYGRIDLPGLMQVLQNCHRGWMITSLGMVVPLTLLTAWRLQQLIPLRIRLDFWEANRLILLASVLNLILPSKMGDVAKAYFIKEQGLDGSLSLSLVIFEKTCDMLSLLLWCVFGLIFYPDKVGPDKDRLFWVLTLGVALGLVTGLLLLSSRKFAQSFFGVGQAIAPPKLKLRLEKLRQSWGEMHQFFWSDQVQLSKVFATSVLIWFLHLLQIWFFVLALRAWTPFLANLALAPLAILAGLLPLTFAGVGTRDAALIIFYQPYLTAPTAAALGLLCTARYLLPAIGGLPFLGRYLSHKF